MLKTIACSLLTVLLSTTSFANAGTCNGSNCTLGETSCSAATAAPANEHSNMNMPTASAPQGTRSYSYQPSSDYTTPSRRAARPGWNSGVRGATSKALGNY